SRDVTLLRTVDRIIGSLPSNERWPMRDDMTKLLELAEQGRAGQQAWKMREDRFIDKMLGIAQSRRFQSLFELQPINRMAGLGVTGQPWRSKRHGTTYPLTANMIQR